ncbi:18.1 kDa class I heat shock protein [Striga asiatica]|uniref:18.1 kDa class I heat shock protein n=1 Tax=Striga asiatica TaxID=4170 RepID=A0A5A7RJ33_STRAF|nr:18.1 kDa class I heat shock protein [Striga asiatica]
MLWDPFINILENEQMIICTPHVRQNSRTKSSFEWWEGPEAHILRAELPGFDKEEVNVATDAERMTLTISGQRNKVEKEEKLENGYYFESSSNGRFVKVFTLPEDSKQGKVWFTVANGFIEITVPKRDVRV